MALAAGVGAAVTARSSAESAVSLERIEVTGSRIKRAEIEGVSPLLILDRKDIEASGLTSIGDFLQNLTIAGSATNTNVNFSGDGTIRLDLRNLGPQRLLVLVNGRRWITIPNLNAVDLQTIPTAIIERVEVLKDGASAIYGSDAISGVVNIITRDDFTGAQANAYYGQWDEDDGETTQADFSIGSTGERGSVFMNASYVKQEPIFAGDREISKEPYFGTGDNFGSLATPEGIVVFPDPATGVLNVLTLEEGATFPDGAPASAYRPYRTTDNYNFAPDNYLLTPSERYGIYTSGRYEITDNIAFYAEGLFNKRESSQRLAAQPLFLGELAQNDNYIPADNPFNPFGFTLGTSGGGTPYLVSRRLLELGHRAFNQDVLTYQFTGGLEGDLDFGGRYWEWEAYYQFARNREAEIISGLVNLDRVQQALDPALCDPDPVCVPLNLFGGAGGNTTDEVLGGGTGTITPEMVDFIRFTAQENFAAERNLYAANLSGSLGDLPAGRLGAAFGYEYRREKGFDQPDSLVSSIAANSPRPPTAGSFTVEESFLEFSIPILRDLPGFNALEASLAARFSDYDTFGSTTNTKYGLRWQPASELLLRATRSESFRAPSIQELFEGTQSAVFIGDPCSDMLALAGSDAPGGRDVPQPQGVIDNCIADGVPADGTYRQFSAARLTSGGNPDVGPETAESTTLGIVYSPPFMQGLDITLDYFDIELENRITRPGLVTILQGCYFGGVSVLCDLVDRDEQSGAITDLRNVVTNIGRTTTAGADFSINWSLPETDIGFFELAWAGSYVEEFVDVFISGEELSEISRVGVNLGDQAYPRWKSNLHVGWSRGDWSAVYTIRYIHHQDEICPTELVAFGVCTDPINTGDAGEFPVNHLESIAYHDAQLSFHLRPWDTRFTAGIRNLFDKDPALCFQCIADSYDPTIHDVPGRFWYLRVTSNF